jgi:hypothetical protein
MFRQGQQDHDSQSQIGVKVGEHRKLMRYEQRAVNQICKAASVRKKQTEPKRLLCVWVVIKGFIEVK